MSSDPDPIEARVKEAVDEPIDREPESKPEPEPAPVELAEIEPLPNTLWEPPPPPRKSIPWMWIALIVALAAGATMLFTLTDVDPVKTVARRVDPEFYTFTDDNGVVHIVDDLEKVPKKYRARAKRKH